MEGPAAAVADRTQVLSVGEFAARLRSQVEQTFPEAWVSGETSNLRTPASGHCYFTLKDERAQIRCVMWRSSVRDVPFRLRDGVRVRVYGAVTLYEPRGDLQLVVRRVRPEGEGALRQQFEDLKRRLAEEGLFDGANKKPLPAFPGHIGIVTSGDGAALQDILTILNRRFPLATASVHSVRVQGYGAADEIAAAIDAFAALRTSDRPDVLIVGRGGGSLEDLWAFNEEIVARAIHRCPIPIVSAVGHETDFSISDFVADLRAATPSMAAELTTPNVVDLRRHVGAFVDRLDATHRSRIERFRRRVLHLVHSYVFNRPLDRLRHQQQRVDDLHERLRLCVLQQLSRQRSAQALLEGRLHLLDPRLPMERGYALVETKGRRVRRASALQPDDDVTLQFLDGARRARVQD